MLSLKYIALIISGAQGIRVSLYKQTGCTGDQGFFCLNVDIGECCGDINAGGFGSCASEAPETYAFEPSQFSDSPCSRFIGFATVCFSVLDSPRISGCFGYDPPEKRSLGKCRKPEYAFKEIDGQRYILQTSGGAYETYQTLDGAEQNAFLVNNAFTVENVTETPGHSLV